LEKSSYGDLSGESLKDRDNRQTRVSGGKENKQAGSNNVWPDRTREKRRTNARVSGWGVIQSERRRKVLVF